MIRSNKMVIIELKVFITKSLFFIIIKPLSSLKCNLSMRHIFSSGLVLDGKRGRHSATNAPKNIITN